MHAWCYATYPPYIEDGPIIGTNISLWRCLAQSQVDSQTHAERRIIYVSIEDSRGPHTSSRADGDGERRRTLLKVTGDETCRQDMYMSVSEKFEPYI